eukprot:121686-Hanusia_phi.AAC.1
MTLMLGATKDKIALGPPGAPRVLVLTLLGEDEEEEENLRGRQVLNIIRNCLTSCTLKPLEGTHKLAVSRWHVPARGRTTFLRCKTDPKTASISALWPGRRSKMRFRRTRLKTRSKRTRSKRRRVGSNSQESDLTLISQEDGPGAWEGCQPGRTSELLTSSFRPSSACPQGSPGPRDDLQTCTATRLSAHRPSQQRRIAQTHIRWRKAIKEDLVSGFLAAAGALLLSCSKMAEITGSCWSSDEDGADGLETIRAATMRQRRTAEADKG